MTRRGTMKRLAGGLLAAIVCVSAAWSAAAQDIKVGAGFILSGWAATYGEDARVGVDLAVDEINEKGGLLGRKVVVEYEDTGADRAKAVALYRRFAADPDVVAMLSISSVEFLALDPVGEEVKLPLISVGSAASYEGFGPWSFRIQLIIDKAMPFVLKSLKDLRGVKSIAVIYDAQNNYTVSEMEAVRAGAEKAGIEVVGVESFRTGEQDFTLQLTRLKGADPDALYVAATTNEAALIISQARSLRIEAQMLGGAGLNDPRIAELPGNTAAGVMTFFPFDPEADEPAVKNFMERYHAEYGEGDPAAYNALGYDAMMLLADAIRRAGSTDRDAVRKALGSTEGLKLANGVFTYEGSGDNVVQSPKLFEYTTAGLKRVTQ